MFVVMILLALLGNLATMCIIIKDRRMRNKTNLLVFSLSFADFLNTTFNTTFNFIYMTQRNWMFGWLFCKITNFISHLAIAASVTTMLAIAFERYRAISSAKSLQSTDIPFSLSVLAIWTVSSGIALPALLFSTTKVYHGNNITSTACLLIWPDGESYVSFMDHVYQVIYLLITYVLPLVGLSCTYSYLSRTLWRLQWQTPVRQENDRRAKKEMRKVAKMFIVILILFGLCWLPYHAYFLVLFYYPDLMKQHYTQHVFLLFFWFAMANSAINPIVYFIMNAKFRIALKKTFPNCSRPVIGVLHTFLGQESSSNYSLGDIQLHLAIFARNRIANKSADHGNKRGLETQSQ